MPSEYEVKRAYQRGAQGGERLPESTLLGLVKTSAEELAANRRGLDDHYRLEEEERRAGERGNASYAESSPLEDYSGLADALDDAQRIAEPAFSIPPSVVGTEAEQLVHALSPRDLVLADGALAPSFLSKVEDPYRTLYVRYFQEARKCALEGAEPPECDPGNSVTSIEAAARMKDVLRAYKALTPGFEREAVSRKAIDDGYCTGALELMRDSGLSKQQLFAALVRSEAAVAANKLEIEWAAEAFVAGLNAARQSSFLPPQKKKWRFVRLGYIYGCAKRLDPSLP